MKHLLIYTVHKAASMFLYQFGAAAATELGLDYHSINNDDQAVRIRDLSWKGYIESQSDSGCFAPIRSGAAEPVLPDNLQDASILLHLRDPRDVLTSLFFSKAYIHPKREGGFNPSDDDRQAWIESGVNDFVLENADQFVKRYTSLLDSLGDRENVVLVSYEEMVTDYPAWLSKAMNALAPFPVPERKRLGILPVANSMQNIEARLLKKFRGEFQVSKESLRRHKRQVTPGDHKRKLTDDTIAELNTRFAPILTHLEYPS